MVEIDPATVPAKMTKIDKLMRDLEELPSIVEHAPISREVFDTLTRDARQLILDLLGLSDKPVGEILHHAYCARIAKEYGDEPGGLASMVGFTKMWLADSLPANDQGQVHFARALCESLIVSAEGHLTSEASIERANREMHAAHAGETRDQRYDRLGPKLFLALHSWPQNRPEIIEALVRIDELLGNKRRIGITVFDRGDCSAECEAEERAAQTKTEPSA